MRDEIQSGVKSIWFRKQSRSPEEYSTDTQIGFSCKSLALPAGSLGYLKPFEISHTKCFTCCTSSLQSGKKKNVHFKYRSGLLSLRRRHQSEWLTDERRGLINVSWRRWLRLNWPRVSRTGRNIEKERWRGETVSECAGEEWGRGEEEGVKEGESLECWRQFSCRSEREWEKCDMLRTNGGAASHSPGRHGVSAAGNRGLDTIFSSAVSSARPCPSSPFCGAEAVSRTACSWQLWLVVGSASSFSQDVRALLITHVCLVLPC